MRPRKYKKNTQAGSVSPHARHDAVAGGGDAEYLVRRFLSVEELQDNRDES